MPVYIIGLLESTNTKQTFLNSTCLGHHGATTVFPLAPYLIVKQEFKNLQIVFLNFVMFCLLCLLHSILRLALTCADPVIYILYSDATG